VGVAVQRFYGRTERRYTMAKRKLTLSDLRMSGRHIFAAPYWAFEPNTYRDGYQRIEELWEPIYAELERGREEEEAQRQARVRAREEKTGTTCDSRLAELERTIGAFSWPGRHRATLYCPTPRALKRCVVCAQRFFGLSKTAACTDECAREQRKATWVRSLVPRNVVHESRLCPECSRPFTPRRKDAVYCSDNCRVAHHRFQAKLLSEDERG